MQSKRTKFKVSRRIVIAVCLPFVAALILRYIGYRFLNDGLDVALSNWIGLIYLFYLLIITAFLVWKRIKFDREND